MQNNSNDTGPDTNFKHYVEAEKAKDPSVQIIKREDLTPVNDMRCQHKSLRLDESVTDFDCLTCNNPSCGKSWLFPYGSWRDKFKKAKKDV